MSDLVERLRDWSDSPETSALCEAAADRIEQLERVLAQERAALIQATAQIDAAADCIEKKFFDEALLHARSLYRHRQDAIAAIDEALNHQASG